MRGSIVLNPNLNNVTACINDADYQNELQVRALLGTPASTTTYGIVKVDGITIQSNNGIISAIYPQIDWQAISGSTSIANKPSIPTSVSELTNDSGYQTLAQVNATIQSVVGAAPDALATLQEIQEQMTAGGSATAALTDSIALKADTTYVNTQLALKANSADLAAVASTGAYSDLIGVPAIPSIPNVISYFTNDSTYQTNAQVDAKIAAVVGGAPTNSNTLKKLSDRLTVDEGNISALNTTVLQKANSATTLAGYGIVDATLVGLSTWVTSIDALYSKVQLLLHFDTLVNGLLYDDSSYHNTVTNLNPSQQTAPDTAVKLIGSSSYQTHGGLSIVPTNAVRTIEDFTIEWSSNIVGNANAGASIFLFTNSIGNGSWKMVVSVNAATRVLSTTINNVEYTCSTLADFNVWESWAIVKSGILLTFFKNGVKQGTSITVPLYATSAYTAGAHLFTVATDTSDSRNNLVGWLDEVRVTSAARYFRNYTVLTTAFPSTVGGSSIGSIQYNRAGFLAGNSNFVYDETNNRFGIGIATPTELFHTFGGNWKIDGVAGTHGLIYPDGTKQTTASVQADWGASSGVSYIRNKPTIPTNLSAFVNDSGYQTSAQVQTIANSAAQTKFDTFTTSLTTETTIRSAAVIALANDIATEATTRGADVAALEVTIAGLQAVVNAIPPSTIISNALIQFTNADVAGGIVTLTHSLNYKYVSVSVYDNQDILIAPDSIKVVDANQAHITLTSRGVLTGTWTAVVRGGVTTAPSGYGTGNLSAPYYGVLNSTTINESGVLGLTGRGVSGTRMLAHIELTSGVGQYMYYAYPANYGIATFVDNTTGLIGGWEGLAASSSPMTIVVNGLLFYVYRTDNANLMTCNWKAY